MASEVISELQTFKNMSKLLSLCCKQYCQNAKTDICWQTGWVTSQAFRWSFGRIQGLHEWFVDGPEQYGEPYMHTMKNGLQTEAHRTCKFGTNTCWDTFCVIVKKRLVLWYIQQPIRCHCSTQRYYVHCIRRSVFPGNIEPTVAASTPVLSDVSEAFLAESKLLLFRVYK